MATVWHHGAYRHAKRYILPASNPAYEFDHLYHGNRCKCCQLEFMVCIPQYQTGAFADHMEIIAADFGAWKRRIKAGEAKPEPQLVSEYSQRISRGADMIRNTQYQLKLTEAKQWYKGHKLSVEAV